MDLRVKFDESPAGSGKTHEIARQAIERAKRGENTLITQPTILLINKTADLIRKLQTAEREKVGNFKCRAECIHSKTNPGQVSHTLIEKFAKSGDALGLIYITTHKALEQSEFLANKDKWHLVIDEEFSTFKHLHHNLPENHHFITRHIRRFAPGPIYQRLTLVGETLARYGKNEGGDEMLSVIQEMSHTLASPNWICEVNRERFERVLAGEASQVSIFCKLDIERVLGSWQSVFVTAANFTDSLMYQLHPDVFEKDENFGKKLLFRKHQNGKLITIHYGVDTVWSKKFMSETDARDRLLDAARGVFAGKEFLLQANKDYDDSIPASVRLPNAPHGLNDYMGYDCLIFVSALNPYGDYFKYLNHNYGLTSEDVRKAIYYQTLYQAVLRTSIRDKDSETYKIIVVPDKSASEYLKTLFPQCTTKKLQNLGIPKPAPDDVEAGRAIRRKKDGEKRQKERAWRLKLINENAGFSNLRGNLRPYYIGAQDSSILSETPIQSAFPSGSILPYSRAPVDEGFSINVEGFEAFVRLLYSYFDNQENVDKENTPVICPAVFDGTGRTEENMILSRNIILDFDGGDLTPEEFPEIFPDLKMVLCNSSRHTKDAPRFRVYIATDVPMAVNQYKRIFKYIIQKIRDAGYYVAGKGRVNKHKLPESGLEATKGSPVNVFNLPCKSSEAPDDSFFSCYDKAGRAELDVIGWIENGTYLAPPATSDEKEEIEQAQQNDDEETVDNNIVNLAMAEWQSMKGRAGGHYAFFDLALKLKRAGLAEHEVRSRLEQAADCDTDARKRKKEIKTNLKNAFHGKRRRAS
jgi:hypothetical protein